MSQATKLKDASEEEERFSLAVLRDAARAFRPAFKGEIGPVVVSLILTIAVIAVDLLKPWPMKFIFDEVLVQERGSPSPMNLSLSQLVVLAAVAFVCIAVVCGWLTARATVAVSQIEKRVTVRIRRQVFEHLHRLAFPFHQSARTGDLLQRLMGDVAGVRRLIFSGWVSLIERVVVVGSTAVVMFVLDPWFASLALLPLPFHGVAISRFSARLKHFTHRQRKRESNASSVATESFQQIRLVKAYAAEDRATDHFTREANTAEEEAVAVSRMGAHMGLFTDVVNAVGVGSVLLVGALRVLDGALTPGELLVLVTYARSLYRPVGKMSTDGGRLATASVSAERLLHVLKIPPEDPGRGLPAPRFHGDVSFEDVHYQHPDGVKALKGVSFTIPQGTLALMEGPNGAGKSTSLSLILRLITPQKGRLLIDGHSAEEFQLDSYRSNFAYVPQDTHLFAASVRENLLYGRPDASDEETEQAARDALLDDVVERLPHGWDEVLGESGTTLSGGEARRLMLARAALRDARILLFDEPLTGLDPAARTTVASAIRRIAAGRTALVVSHGQASELEPDVIIRLEEGRCVAERQSQTLLTLGSSGMFRPGREVAQFLDDRSALALFRQAGLDVYSVERDFTRVRPNPTEGDVVSFVFRGRGIDGQDIELPGYVRISKNGAAEELAEWMDMPCESTPFGPGVRLLPGGRAGLFLFPNDRLLPGLNACADQEQLEEALDELEELNADGWRLKRNESVFIPKRYRPERRFISTATLTLLHSGTGERKRAEVVMRYFGDDRGRRIAEMTHAIRTEGLFPYVPRPLGAAFEGRLFVEEFVQADEFTPSLLAGRVDPDVIASRLRSLHAAPVDLRHHAARSDLFDGNREFLTSIGQDPMLGSTAERLAEGLARNLPEERPSVPIHGDLHPSQILIGPNGPVFVDLEAACMGDPYQDLGNLVSHLIRRAGWETYAGVNLMAFTYRLIETYINGHERRPPGDLRFFVAGSLIARARAAIRRQEDNWPSRVERTLQIAEAVLGTDRERARIAIPPLP